MAFLVHYYGMQLKCWAWFESNGSHWVNGGIRKDTWPKYFHAPEIVQDCTWTHPSSSEMAYTTLEGLISMLSLLKPLI